MRAESNKHWKTQDSGIIIDEKYWKAESNMYGKLQESRRYVESNIADIFSKKYVSKKTANAVIDSTASFFVHVGKRRSADNAARLKRAACLPSLSPPALFKKRLAAFLRRSDLAAL